MVVEVTEPFDDITLDRATGRLRILAQLESEPLGEIDLPVIDGRVRADAIRTAVADRFAPVVLARYFALRDRVGSDSLVDELWPRTHPLVGAVADVIDRLAALARGDEDGRKRGMPRRLVVEPGARLPSFVLGRRNVAVELRIGDVLVSSMEYVVGPAGIASSRALRNAAIDAAGPSLARVVVRELLLGVPFDRTTLRERLARRLSASG